MHKENLKEIWFLSQENGCVRIESLQENLFQNESGDDPRGGAVQVEKYEDLENGALFKISFYFTNEQIRGGVKRKSITIQATYSKSSSGGGGNDENCFEWDLYQWGKTGQEMIEAEQILQEFGGEGDVECAMNKLDFILKSILRQDRDQWLMRLYEKDLEDSQTEEFERNAHTRFQHRNMGRF